MNIYPNHQQVFKVFNDAPYDHLGPLFEKLSTDDVLDGMEGQHDYVYVRGAKVAIGFDRTRNSVAVLDVEYGDQADEAVELLNHFAQDRLTCSPSNADLEVYLAICDGMTYSFQYWA